MNVAIVGLGLIGGALAQRNKKPPHPQSGQCGGFLFV